MPQIVGKYVSIFTFGGHAVSESDDALGFALRGKDTSIKNSYVLLVYKYKVVHYCLIIVKFCFIKCFMS